jgi:hypothetical protein
MAQTSKSVKILCHFDTLVSFHVRIIILIYIEKINIIIKVYVILMANNNMMHPLYAMLPIISYR